eukprot:3170874-Rhodomonas_salina.2
MIQSTLSNGCRWAEQHHLERREGHSFGFLQLKECLKWCLDLGVNVVTVRTTFRRPTLPSTRSHSEINCTKPLLHPKLWFLVLHSNLCSLSCGSSGLSPCASSCGTCGIALRAVVLAIGEERSDSEFRAGLCVQHRKLQEDARGGRHADGAGQSQRETERDRETQTQTHTQIDTDTQKYRDRQTHGGTQTHDDTQAHRRRYRHTDAHKTYRHADTQAQCGNAYIASFAHTDKRVSFWPSSY